MIKKLSNAVFSEGYIDDHNGRQHDPINIAAIHVDSNGVFDLVYVERDCAGFCVNPFYMKDGKAHLGCGSINGTVYVRQNGGLEKAVEAFNRDHSREACEKSYGTIGALKLVYA